MSDNSTAFNEPSNSLYFEDRGGGMDAYLNSASGKYSSLIEKMYKERKADGTGTDENNNPYPLKNKPKPTETSEPKPYE